MQVFYLAVLGKFVCDVLLCRFLVNVRHKDDPSFYSWGTNDQFSEMENNINSKRCLQRAARVSTSLT